MAATSGAVHGEVIARSVRPAPQNSTAASSPCVRTTCHARKSRCEANDRLRTVPRLRVRNWRRDQARPRAAPRARRVRLRAMRAARPCSRRGDGLLERARPLALKSLLASERKGEAVEVGRERKEGTIALSLPPQSTTRRTHGHLGRLVSVLEGHGATRCRRAAQTYEQDAYDGRKKKTPLWAHSSCARAVIKLPVNASQRRTPPSRSAAGRAGSHELAGTLLTRRPARNNFLCNLRARRRAPTAFNTHLGRSLYRRSRRRHIAPTATCLTVGTPAQLQRRTRGGGGRRRWRAGGHAEGPRKCG
ncbi:hypothetical protein FA95DRAFT_1194760 [Auriscalpium vulgare]|uniref:Uncharacterized protein n=1 Tax=Auriscalpium vulgare TaxID=40419 RepID=A0ACB8R3A5_9AGAM|nr:hypothetical protein FA95DRAFT_1194760 [Auriscalpium vulgare]